MTLGIVVITNKKDLPDSFTKRLNFADEVLIFKSDKYHSFAEKRNHALQKIKTDWVLFVDDDEIISKELASEIKQKITNKSISGYYLKRHDLCFYQELKWGEIKNQKILRLARTDAGQFSRSVHEIWQVNGKTATLDNLLYHQKDNFISGFLGRVQSYAYLDADELTKEGKRFSYFRLLFLPTFKFLQNYFLRQGFRDGLPGLFLSYLMSVQSFVVRIVQWERRSIK